MNVYLAAPWTHKEEAARFANVLEAAGHAITKKWWEHREVPGYLASGISTANRDELAQQAAEDIAGVFLADAFVLLNYEKSEGKAVETGVALALGVLQAKNILVGGPKRFILVGTGTNLFHYIPCWDIAQTPGDVLALLDSRS